MKITKTWLKTHQWFLRTSNRGESYNDFRRKRKGVWNDADPGRWTGQPKCDMCGGFFGIDPDCSRFGLLLRQTLELCEWRGSRVTIDGDKICVSSYRVVATDEEISDRAFRLCGFVVLRSGTHQIESGERVLVRGRGRVRLTRCSGEVSVYGSAKVIVDVQAHGGISCYGRATVKIKEQYWNAWVSIRTGVSNHIIIEKTTNK